MAQFTHKERWMQNFEAMVREIRPDLASKIEWQSAIHFYNQGRVSDEAARFYCDNRKVTP